MKFEKDEIAVFEYVLNSTSDPKAEKFHGAEVTIMSSAFSSRFGEAYDILWPDGEVDGCVAYMLRKKKPPEEEINWMEKLNLTIKAPEKETA